MSKFSLHKRREAQDIGPIPCPEVLCPEVPRPEVSCLEVPCPEVPRPEVPCPEVPRQLNL